MKENEENIFLNDLERVFSSSIKKKEKIGNVNENFKTALLNFDLDTLSEILEKHPNMATIKVDVAGKKISPLIYATSYNNAPLFDLLVKHGASPEKVSSKDDSVFVCALEHDNLHVFKYFHENNIKKDTYLNTTTSMFNLYLFSPEKIIEYIADKNLFYFDKQSTSQGVEIIERAGQSLAGIKNQKVLEKFLDSQSLQKHIIFDSAIVFCLQNSKSYQNLKFILKAKFNKKREDVFWINKNALIETSLGSRVKVIDVESFPLSLIAVSFLSKDLKLNKILSISGMTDNLKDFIEKNPQSLEIIKPIHIFTLVNFIKTEFFIEEKFEGKKKSLIDIIFSDPVHHLPFSDPMSEKFLYFLNKNFHEEVIEKLAGVPKSNIYSYDWSKKEFEKWNVFAEKICLKVENEEENLKKQKIRIL